MPAGAAKIWLIGDRQDVASHLPRTLTPSRQPVAYRIARTAEPAFTAVVAVLSSALKPLNLSAYYAGIYDCTQTAFVHNGGAVGMAWLIAGLR